MIPDVGNFEVVRYFGSLIPEVVCKKARGYARRRYGFHKACGKCNFRFACATGNLYDVIGEDIEGEEHQTIIWKQKQK